MAFQLVDDVLDYSLSTTLIGKERGTDFQERKVTLPLSHLLEQATEQDQQEVRMLLQQERIVDSDVTRVIELMHCYQSLEYTREQAKLYIDKAKEILLSLPSSHSLATIQQVATYILHRNR